MSWWDNIFKKPEKINFTVEGNPDAVEGYLYRGKRIDEGIVYCHGGMGEKVNINGCSDAKSYSIVKGYPVLIIMYDAPLSPLNDTDEVLTACKLLKILTGVKKVHLVGVSRGGYVVLMTMAFYPQFFDRCVSYIPPIDLENYDWSVWESDPMHAGMIEETKRYFAETPSPMMRWHDYIPIKDKILVIGGGTDKICPVKTHALPFAAKTGCKVHIVRSAGHNAHQTTEGRSKCVDFLGGKI